MLSNHLILCPSRLLPSIFPSIRVFSNESVFRIKWPKYWSFSFSISPSNEYSGLISFWIDWFDHLAVQGTLKSLLQHQSSKALILWRSAFFIVQLSHPYMTSGKTIALVRWTFVSKVMFLLTMLSRLVIAFHPRSKCLNFMAAFTICSDFGGKSMQFSRPEYWSGLPFPSPGDLPNPGIKPRFRALQADSLPAEPQGKPWESIGRSETAVIPAGVSLSQTHTRFFARGIRSGICFKILQHKQNKEWEEKMKGSMAKYL